MRKLIRNLDEAKRLGLDEGAVSKVVDTKTKKIVGYMKGSTFASKSINAIDDAIQEFAILADPAIFGDDAFIGHGVDLTCVLLALGIGCSYAEEWGDWRGLIEAIREKPETVYFYLHPPPVRLEQDVVDAAIKDVTK